MLCRHATSDPIPHTITEKAHVRRSKHAVDMLTPIRYRLVILLFYQVPDFPSKHDEDTCQAKSFLAYVTCDNASSITYVSDMFIRHVGAVNGLLVFVILYNYSHTATVRRYRIWPHPANLSPKGFFLSLSPGTCYHETILAFPTRDTVSDPILPCHSVAKRLFPAYIHVACMCMHGWKSIHGCQHLGLICQENAGINCKCHIIWSGVILNMYTR